MLARERIQKLGISERFHRDQSESFEYNIVFEMCMMKQIKTSMTSQYHPERNTQAEMINRTI
jgi:hypothetical protein